MEEEQLDYQTLDELNAARRRLSLLSKSALGRLTREEVSELAIGLRSGAPDRIEFCLTCLQGIANPPDFLVEVIGSLVAHAEPRIRSRAIATLSTFHEKAIAYLRVFIECLDDSDEGLFNLCLSYLGSIGSLAQPAVAVLRTQFVGTNSVEKRVDIASALIRIDPRQADMIEFLVSFYQSQPEDVRAPIAELIAMAGPHASSAIPFLLADSESSNEELKEAAARALGAIRRADSTA
jgi:hypothetical protein